MKLIALSSGVMQRTLAEFDNRARVRVNKIFRKKITVPQKTPIYATSNNS